MTAINYMGVAAKDYRGRVQSAADSEQELSHYQRELANLENDLRDYMRTEGGRFIPYMQNHGKRFGGIDAIVATEMEEGIVAAMMKYAENGHSKGILIANARDNGFDEQVNKFVREYIDRRAPKLSSKEKIALAKKHVFNEELGHKMQPDCMQNIEAELDINRTLYDYYIDMASKSKGKEAQEYIMLADIAKERYAQHLQAAGQTAVQVTLPAILAAYVARRARKR